MLNCPITGKACMKYKAFHVTNIKNNEVSISNVCEDCLSQISNFDGKILETTRTSETCSAPAETKLIEEKQNNSQSLYCEFCKLTLEELLNKSRLGCEKCYQVFEKPLIIAFEKLQRNPQLIKKELKHVGSVPSQWKKKQAQETEPKKFLLELKQKLALFSREEKYEKCKEIKDCIYAFESLLKNIDEFKKDCEQQVLIRNQISEFIYFFREKEL